MLIHTAQPLLGTHLSGGAVGSHTTLIQQHDPIRIRRRYIQIMQNRQNRRTLGGKLPAHLQGLFLMLNIQRRRRLIQEH